MNPEEQEGLEETEPLSDPSIEAADTSGLSDDEIYYRAFGDDGTDENGELPEEPVVVIEPAAVVEPDAPAFDFSGLNLTEAQEEALRERLAEDPLTAVRDIIRQELNTHDLVRTASDSHLEALTRQAPEFARQNAPMLRQAINSLPPAQRGTKQAVDYAVLYAVGNRAQQVGVQQALQEAAAQFGSSAKPANAANPATPARKPAVALAPSQRATAPVSSPQAVRATAKSITPQNVRNPQNAVIQRMAARSGMSVAAVRQMMAEADQL